MTKGLSGKVAIVTGSSRGIGREIAERLAENGAKVVVNYASSPAKAEEVVGIIKQGGGEARAIQADISQVAEIERLFRETIEAYGGIDILVNNAGIMTTKPIAAMTEEDFDQQFAINVKGTYFAIQQAFRHMNSGGRIINFSTSVAGQMFPTYSVYAGTKGAVEQFTRQLAKEFGPKGITINAVAPGPINTELFTVGKSEEQIAGIVNMNAFGRLGEPDDIAGVVLFLASEESKWVTGQTLRVNGGFV
ncbi:SDR family oxidoreductase [Paenibacillus lautus]|jgi:3-oxoacyl-[acyl-carrier protein] reductase|uniref:SDR family oxidoreductase n=1 Tax=Paenibacillus lautus TaxID=1401 RepID=UPI0026EE84B5|nr:SDR family oxidoreductase [Paenibacillus lautus]MBY0164087.1 SDR family oxidoreductase [Cytobacillus firmus]MCI1776988.1 SDR family oxidoreductase [Paenibacillus lautus]